MLGPFRQANFKPKQLDHWAQSCPEAPTWDWSTSQTGTFLISWSSCWWLTMPLYRSPLPCTKPTSSTSPTKSALSATAEVNVVNLKAFSFINLTFLKGCQCSILLDTCCIIHWLIKDWNFNCLGENNHCIYLYKFWLFIPLSELHFNKWCTTEDYFIVELTYDRSRCQSLWMIGSKSRATSHCRARVSVFI